MATEVFDAQVHVWADDRPDRPWPAEGAARAHRFPALGADELARTMDDAGVDRAVLVPPSFEGDRNDVVLDAIERYPDRFVAMARIPVGQRLGSPMLRDLAGHPGVAGVRLTFHRPEMRPWLADGSADWLWPALAGLGLAVMVFAPGENAALRRIATANPRLRMAIDTLGLSLTVRDKEIDPPIRDLERFVDVPNVVVKATALPGYVTDLYPYESLAPRLRWLFDIFGPDRVMWASDTTRVSVPYRDIVTFAGELGVLSDDELAAFMGGNLARWLASR